MCNTSKQNALDHVDTMQVDLDHYCNPHDTAYMYMHIFRVIYNYVFFLGTGLFLYFRQNPIYHKAEQVCFQNNIFW